MSRLACLKRFIEIDKQELINLYQDQKLSTIEICEHYGVTDTTIYRWLQRLQIKRRSAGFQPKNRRGKKPITVDISQMVKMYQEEKKTISEIGKIFGIGQATTYRILTKERIIYRKRGVPKGTKYTKQHSDKIALGKIGHKVWYPTLEFNKILGHIVRSEWEKKIFLILRQQGIKYKYEPKSFRLTLTNKKQVTWRPDAILEDGRLFEIKGPVLPLFIQKMYAFKQQYPKEKIVLVTSRQNLKRLPSKLFDEIQLIGKYGITA